METLRLQKIQQPSHLERLLEALVTRGALVPKDAFQIRASRALSPQLQRIASQAVQGNRVWACWADSQHAWLFTCELSVALSRERGAPVLEVDVFDESGAPKDSGTWEVDEEGKWRRSGGV
jgi:hypothetical protein